MLIFKIAVGNVGMRVVEAEKQRRQQATALAAEKAFLEQRIIQQRVYTKFAVSSFDTWNCDRPMTVPDAFFVNADLRDSSERKLMLPTVAAFYKPYNALRYFQAMPQPSMIALTRTGTFVLFGMYQSQLYYTDFTDCQKIGTNDQAKRAIIYMKTISTTNIEYQELVRLTTYQYQGRLLSQ